MTETQHGVASGPRAFPNGGRRRGADRLCQPMNKRLLRVIALGFGWLVIAALIVAILYPLEVAKFWRIDANSRMTTGVIIDKDCGYRYLGQVTYIFDADRQRYTGAHTSDMCASAAKGQHISVYYNTQNPTENTTDAPPYDLNDGILSIVLGAIILSSFIIWEISRSWCFGSS
jgi:regulator of extracellular matrix RemA (YlzA/DUF370 family)